MTAISIAFGVLSQAQTIKHGSWEINLDNDSKLLSIKNNGTMVLDDVYATADFAFESEENLKTYKSTEAESAFSNRCLEDYSGPSGCSSR